MPQKRTAAYWKKRFEALEAASNKYGQQTYSQIEPAFDAAQRQIQGQIEAWYGRFATNNQITMQEALEMMQAQTDHLILDVRTAEEYRSGHIPDAVNIPNETIGSSAIPNLPNKEQQIFVYCRSGNRSKQAAGKLAKLGYTNVFEIGGISAWPGKIVTE